MWQVMEVCEQCGSDDIRAVAGDDPSTGYHGEEWRCMRCGANCEYLERAETVQTEVQAA
jgi:hypothetical protein